MSKPRLEQTIDELAQMDMAGLRELWRRRFGAPPKLRSRDLMRRILAFELQAEAHGGPSPELRQRLRTTSSARSTKPAFQPGTTITREWRGERHVVQVTARGFEYDGTTYESLSELARQITGARWSGPRFFGLKQSGRRAAA